ncbi:GDNF-inducible zinc finger protein 1 [Papilio machaon]|uniref:GDNF-inducible zinc finger protein 1 n=1 Tax=Papilio machaon TaxID=76193 RepID=A0A0N1IHT8_PAPMA|nr:GDNF-inducible zinc finger protein 1 [Papilio machaon]
MEDTAQIAFNVNVKVEEIEDEINTQETNLTNENNVSTRPTNKKSIYTQVISIADSEDENVTSENSNSASDVSRCNQEDCSSEIPASSSGIYYESSHSSDIGSVKNGGKRANGHLNSLEEILYRHMVLYHTPKSDEPAMMLPLKCVKGVIVESGIPLQINKKLLYKYLADIDYMNYTPLEIISKVKGNNTISNNSERNDITETSTENTLKQISNVENKQSENHEENDVTKEITENTIKEISTVANTEIDDDIESDYESDNYAFQIQLDAEIQRDIEIEEQISKVFKASKCYKKFLDKEANDPIEDIYNDDVCIIVKNEDVLVISDSDEDRENSKLEKTTCDETNSVMNIDIKKDINNSDIEIEYDERFNSNDNEIRSYFDDVTVKIEPCDNTEEISNNIEIKKETNKEKDVKDSNVINKVIKKENLDIEVKDEFNGVKNKSVKDFLNEVEKIDFKDVKTESCIDENEGIDIQNVECEIEISDWRINEIAGCSKKRKDKNTRHNAWKIDDTTYSCSDCTYKGCYKKYIDHLMYCQRKHQTCTYCRKTFDNIELYLTHFTEHKLRYLSCPQCLKNFSVLRYLVNHISFHINEMYDIVPNETDQYVQYKTYICLLCEELVEIDDFFIHWESHLDLNEGGVMEMSDSEADMKSIMTPEMVEKAIKILLETSRQNKNKVCIVCFKNHVRRNDSKRHLIEHLLHEAKVNMTATNSKLRCPMCNLDIQELTSWRQHMREHAQLRMYRCSLCPKYFSDSSNYSKHRKVHNQHKYICDLCGGKFCAKSSIIKHLAVHKPMNPINCTRCHKTLYSEHALKRHMRVRHSVSQFACTVCKRKFVTCKQRWDHMWNKHKLRKYVADCPICNKQYRRIIDVKNHMRLEHGIKKPDDFYKKNLEGCTAKEKARKKPK